MLKKISLFLVSSILVLSTIGSAYAVTLKASHQWPGTPRADGSYDVRHEMVQIIADEVAKACLRQRRLSLTTAAFQGSNQHEGVWFQLFRIHKKCLTGFHW